MQNTVITYIYDQLRNCEYLKSQIPRVRKKCVSNFGMPNNFIKPENKYVLYSVFLSSARISVVLYIFTHVSCCTRATG